MQTQVMILQAKMIVFVGDVARAATVALSGTLQLRTQV
jgi:hypothetical protein